MKRFKAQQTYFALIMLILSVFLITGCGGGGGGDAGGGSGSGPGPGPGSGSGPGPGSGSGSGSDSGGVCVGANCVPLGAAGDLGAAAGYAILAKTGVSTVPPSVVTGNVAVSPAHRDYLTGWSETAASDASDLYATSDQVVAPFRLYASDYAVPTPTNLTAAVSSMELAYTNAAGRTASSAATTNVGGGTLTSLTFSAVPGGVTVYEWGSAVTIPTDLTFDGSATDVFILKVAGTLDMAANKKIILSGGALPQNIFWQVTDVVTINEGAHFEGIILTQTMIAMKNLASINGRLLAQSEVTLIATTVTQP